MFARKPLVMSNQPFFVRDSIQISVIVFLPLLLCVVLFTVVLFTVILCYRCILLILMFTVVLVP